MRFTKGFACIHRTNATIIPEQFGLRLYHGYVSPKKLWEFPQGEHSAIMEPATQFWKEVVEFWQTSPPVKHE